MMDWNWNPFLVEAFKPLRVMKKYVFGTVPGSTKIKCIRKERIRRTFTLFQLARAFFNIPTILAFFTKVWLFRNDLGPGSPALFYALLRQKRSGQEAPSTVAKMLDICPWMACVFDPMSGCTPLHFACDPLLSGDLLSVRKLLKIFPEAARVGNKYEDESIPLHRVTAHRCFGWEDEDEVRKLSVIKGEDFPNNGFVYTKDNTTVCPIIEELVRADPSTLTMLGGCVDRSSEDESEDNSSSALLYLNPMQQLWHHYTNSEIGKKEIMFVEANKNRFIESLNSDGVCDKSFEGMVVVWQAMTIMVRALYAFFDNEAEDNGSEPLIHACIGIGHHCPSSFLEFLLKLDAGQASRLDERGNLPLHIAAKSNQFTSSEKKTGTIARLIKLYKNGPRCRNHDGRLPLKGGILYSDDDGSWVEPLLTELEEQDERTGLKPFMLAASCESKSSLDTTYHVLRGNPNAILI